MKENKKPFFPIPENLKFSHIPEDINQFINDMLPHMGVMVSLRVPPAIDEMEVIHDFVVYIKGKARSKGNLDRWKIYDPSFHDSEKFFNFPYYKWFLHTLEFFCRSAIKDYQDKVAQECNISDLELDDENGEDGVFDRVSWMNQSQRTLDDIVDRDVMLGQFRKFLDQYAKVSIGMRKGRIQENRFFSCSRDLFELMMQDRTNDEMSSRFRVSNSAILQWKQKVRYIAMWWMDHPGLSPNDLISEGV